MIILRVGFPKMHPWAGEAGPGSSHRSHAAGTSQLPKRRGGSCGAWGVGGGGDGAGEKQELYEDVGTKGQFFPALRR